MQMGTVNRHGFFEYEKLRVPKTTFITNTSYRLAQITNMSPRPRWSSSPTCEMIEYNRKLGTRLAIKLTLLRFHP
jgi:hypothetical protein